MFHRDAIPKTDPRPNEQEDLDEFLSPGIQVLEVTHQGTVEVDPTPTPGTSSGPTPKG